MGGEPERVPMKTWKSLSLAVVTVAMCVAPTPIFAQPPPAGPDSKAGSELSDETIERISSLNKEATAEMGAGSFASACPKLETAVQLAPESAVGARINLAECYEKTDRVARAWTQHAVVAVLAEKKGETERVKSARDAMARLGGRVATIELQLSTALLSLPGVAVTVDGAPLSELPWTKVFAVDVAAHTVEVQAPGHRSRSIKVDGLGTGENRILPVAMLERADAAPPSAKVAPTVAIPNTAVFSSGPTQPRTEGRSKVPGLVGLGVAVAAFAAGGALVGVALGVPAELEAKAPRDAAGNPRCHRAPQPGEDAACADLRSQAQSGSTMGNVGVGLLVGGGVVAAASIIYLLLPSARPASGSTVTHLVAPVAAPGGGGLVWTGSF